MVGAVAIQQGTDGGGVRSDGDEGITLDNTDFARGVGLQGLRGTASSKQKQYQKQTGTFHCCDCLDTPLRRGLRGPRIEVIGGAGTEEAEFVNTADEVNTHSKCAHR